MEIYDLQNLSVKNASKYPFLNAIFRWTHFIFTYAKTVKEFKPKKNMHKVLLK